MRLTRRGATVVVVCVAGFVAAGFFGSRSLNAVVLPGLVALVAGFVQLRRTTPPRVERTVPKNDFLGETHAVELRFPDVSRPYVAFVSDDLDDGLDGDAGPTKTTVGGDPTTYRVTYQKRGERQLGPATVVATDVFGLFKHDVTCRGTDSLLVYPRVHGLAGWAQRDLRALHNARESDERAEFDSLREYVRGDALRDIHWKTSAKRDDLIVQEFTGRQDVEAVTVVGEADAAGVDAMAEAVASVALALHEADIPVAVVLANGRVETEPDIAGRMAVLEHAARAVEGPAQAADPDILVRADGSDVTVVVGDRTVSFAAMRRGSDVDPPSAESTAGGVTA